MINFITFCFQNPATGLLPSTDDGKYASVRENVYSVLAVWGLAMAYDKSGGASNKAKGSELHQVENLLILKILKIYIENSWISLSSSSLPICVRKNKSIKV